MFTTAQGLVKQSWPQPNRCDLDLNIWASFLRVRVLNQAKFQLLSPETGTVVRLFGLAQQRFRIWFSVRIKLPFTS